ncbi:CBS domain-containing protein [Paludifilum halophilum]|uniref:CBS domain-containing protein n=1 Tax=Paludifilum halophilum TaxID=1642702 RepID=A0A235B5E6_9BACL|nr:CBS domain-containing protein [Paludifilum halophilum]OYD07528.1 hypothetical protein CHM34_11580 [Paludifilum halophilum]
MLIRNCLTPRNELETVCLDTSVEKTLERLKEYRLESIPVLDRQKRFAGITGYGCIFKAWVFQGEPDGFFTAQQSISSTVQTVPVLTMDSDFEETLPIMVRYPFVPIVEDKGTFAGIVKISAIESALKCTFGYGMKGTRFLIGVFIDMPHVLEELLDSIKSFGVNIISIASFDAGNTAARRILLKVSPSPYDEQIVQRLTEKGFRVINVHSDHRR